MRRYDFIVPEASDGRRLDQYVAQQLVKEVSRVEVQKIIDMRGVELNGQLVKQKNRELKPGDKVTVELEDVSPKKPKAENIPLQIVHEDDDLLVIDKPAGMVVHPAPGHRHGTVVNALLGSGVQLSDSDDIVRPGIVHRLDKDTSGLLMVAKNNKTHRALVRMLQERRIHKVYDAIVRGPIDFNEGFVDAPIGRHPKNRYEMTVRRDAQSREAYTEYKVVARSRSATRLWVRLHTGRTHQIRVHMKHLGHLVLGDELYGETTHYGRLALHAASLDFEHPSTGELVHFEAALPEDYVKILKAEGFE